MKITYRNIIKLCLAGSFLFVPGCTKKGEDDPFMSLKTRKARLTGEWKMIKYEYSSIDDGSGCYNKRSRIKNYDGTTLTETNNGVSYWGTDSQGNDSCTYYTDTDTYSYSYYLVIDKNGTYTRIISEGERKYEYTGNWLWKDSPKNKGSVCLDYSCYTIEKLKNKELVLQYHSYTKSNSDPDYWYEYTSDEKLTFEKIK